MIEKNVVPNKPVKEAMPPYRPPVGIGNLIVYAAALVLVVGVAVLLMWAGRAVESVVGVMLIGFALTWLLIARVLSIVERVDRKE